VDSGEKMRFSLRTNIAGVRYCDWMYGSSCHDGRVASSPDIRSVCDRATIFSPAVP
jgi:hypothetical protein